LLTTKNALGTSKTVLQTSEPALSCALLAGHPGTLSALLSARRVSEAALHAPNPARLASEVALLASESALRKQNAATKQCRGTQQCS
jgi:hypothetical protein